MSTTRDKLNAGRYRSPGGAFVAALPVEDLAEILDRMPEERVRAALDSGEIAQANYAQVLEWLGIKESEREAEAAEARLREIDAAERAAAAAEKSARWAIVATVISTAAFIISALPYISQ